MSVFPDPRHARTSLSCPRCGAMLDIMRTCHEAYMYCSVCSRRYQLSPFIPAMDEVMEGFLEQLFADRV